MRNSIRRFRERYLFSAVLVVLAVGSAYWDWHLSVWDWLGHTNGGESNGATLRNFSLIFLPLVAIYLTLRRIKVAEREARTSRDNLRTARDALDLNYKTLSYTEHRDREERRHNQYASASERLSSDSMSARLGAIYELQNLTRHDLDQFHVRTMRMLCAFVRFPPHETDEGSVPRSDPCGQPLHPDVQAAMEVIGSRTDQHTKIESDARYVPDLRRANLVRLELRDSNLSGIDMRGSRFWGADLMHADLSRCELQYTDFSSPWIVRGDDLAEITSRKGSFVERNNAIFSSQTLLIGTKLSNSILLSANLSGCNLQGANLSGANLPEADLTSALLVETDLSHSQLLDANLSKAHLFSTKLVDARFTRVNLSGADLSGSLENESTSKSPPIGLTQDQLDEACADPDNPPKLDESSGLTWNNRPCAN
ncbi:MAG: pentapeptide repeat-containing protein [bacterium]|nr:pentapeptide repeat-containing protein [bacterium]